MMDALTALRLIALNDFRAHSVLELTAGLYRDNESNED